jgi:unsaturated chondroitin disaccharide hydrolase
VQIQLEQTADKLIPKIERFFTLAGDKVRSTLKTWEMSKGTPVFTVQGQYTSRGWTEWTQGFHVGRAILQFDATDDKEFLDIGREQTIRYMASHVSHIGVHDHGFNNVSTYGNLRRLMLEGRIDHNPHELETYELALKVSGAVQAARFVPTNTGIGYIYSFNGPQSLFADTMRTLRSLILAHRLGHLLMGEADKPINLLGRALEHAETTARYNVYLGTQRDIYDMRGRVAHESIFNRNDGQYRSPASQQGYSPFTTWTRGAAWVILGFAEQIEFLHTLDDAELAPWGGRATLLARYCEILRATSDYYIDGYSSTDGVPFWDTGAPGLLHLAGYQQARSNPYNAHEPVDASAAAIAAQGFIRLGRYLLSNGDEAGRRYLAAGLTIAATLLEEPYLSQDPAHQGLLLHSVYHRPNGWDHIPAEQSIPCDESSMWGDYHIMELALLIQRMARQSYLSFFGEQA